MRCCGKFLITKQNVVWVHTWYVRVGVFVAEVHGAAHWVNARVVFDRRGTDEGAVYWDQLIFVHALPLLRGHLVAHLAVRDETYAVRRAAGVDTAAVAVALEGWRRKRERDGIKAYFVKTKFKKV